MERVDWKPAKASEHTAKKNHGDVWVILKDGGPFRGNQLLIAPEKNDVIFISQARWILRSQVMQKPQS